MRTLGVFQIMAACRLDRRAFPMKRPAQWRADAPREHSGDESGVAVRAISSKLVAPTQKGRMP